MIIHLNGLFYKSHVNSDSTVIDFLVKMIFFPYIHLEPEI